MQPTRRLLVAVISGAAFCQTTLAQSVLDYPPATLLPTCKKPDFDSTGIDVPAHMDMLVSVDATGTPLSAKSLTSSENPVLTSAYIALAMSCQYMPGRANGNPAAGTSRFAFPTAQAASRRPGALPAIVNISECAPKAEDYPPESARRNETGTTRIGFTIDEKGKLKAFGVANTSGHLLLDYTALIKLAGCTFKPGKAADGSAIGGSFTIEYVWRLE